MKHWIAAFAITLVWSSSLPAQTTTGPTGPASAPDTGGNMLLNGTYYFRELACRPASPTGLKEAVAVFGNIAFDGNGNYTVSAMVNDSSGTAPYPLSTKGTYVISASGLGYLTHPLSVGDRIFALAAQLSPFQPAILVGSATETTNGFNDIFVAAPLIATSPTAASLVGVYNVAYLNFPLTAQYPAAFDPTYAYNAYFQMTADGMGSIGSVSIAGHEGTGTSFSTVEPGVTYTFTNGAAIMNFTKTVSPLPGQTLGSAVPVSGQQYLYMSPDGNLVFGGSPTGWDMFVGVRGTAGNGLNGLYFETGIDGDLSQFGGSQKTTKLSSYYGAFNAATGMIVADRRTLSQAQPGAFHNTFAANFTLTANGTYSDTQTQYMVGDGGAVRIGYGAAAHIGLEVAVQAPSLSGPGIYLDPDGIENAASFAPFTAGISPSEFIELTGSNLSAGTALSQAGATLPTVLNNVQVSVNGAAAAVYSVSPTTVLAVVPAATTGPYAQIQVLNGGLSSNVVTTPVNLTTPGVFVQASGGVLYGAVLHQDGATAVTAESPAEAGEIVSVYCTGLGAVSPAGSTVNPITVSIGGMPAAVSYAGAAPGLEGVDQINVTIPAGLSSGNAVLAIIGPDSVATEAMIAVSSTIFP
jgi:uncharacterized protein (TIGR03437 family)